MVFPGDKRRPPRPPPPPPPTQLKLLACFRSGDGEHFDVLVPAEIYQLLVDWNTSRADRAAMPSLAAKVRAKTAAVRAALKGAAPTTPKRRKSR